MHGSKSEKHLARGVDRRDQSREESLGRRVADAQEAQRVRRLSALEFALDVDRKQRDELFEKYVGDAA
jgi:hypothetical protein